MISCQSSESGSTDDQNVLSLKNSFEGEFYIGAALGFRQLTEENTAETQLIAREFSSLTGENCMKWERIHPQPDSFSFRLADKSRY